MKKPIGINVLDAAISRIEWVFDNFPKIYVSFSGGKDSSVMLHLVMDIAIKRGRKVGLLFIDLEAQYKLTIDHVSELFDIYADYIDPYWIALPLHLRNAVSQFQPHWICWDKTAVGDWVRKPPKIAITDESAFSFFRYGMEFEEFVPEFGHFFGGKEPTACFIGSRPPCGGVD
jgi:predicted phosphoadenosine phosphosulfate sulfurtransferase